MYHFSLSTYQYSFKIKTKQQIFDDFVVSVFFWADACNILGMNSLLSMIKLRLLHFTRPIATKLGLS